MSWPNDDLTTTDFQSASTPGAPSRARSMLYRLILRTKSIIAARGAANGVCELNAAGKVPTTRISRGAAGGVASLGSNGKVIAGQLDGLLMTQAERTKLGGVEAGATADQTAAQIVALLDARLGGTGWRMQLSGFRDQRVGWVAASSGATRVTFQPAFSQTPYIMLQASAGAPSGGRALALATTNASSSGFNVIGPDSGALNYTPAFWWLAFLI